MNLTQYKKNVIVYNEFTNLISARLMLKSLNFFAIRIVELVFKKQSRKKINMRNNNFFFLPNNTQYEKLKEEIKVLNSITQQTQISSLSVLREILKSKASDEKINIDATWMTMNQQQQQKSQHPPNLKLLKQLISKNTQFYKDKQNNYVTGINKKAIQNSPQHKGHLKTLSKDTSQKSLVSSNKMINNSNGDTDLQKFLKQQILSVNHANPCNVKPLRKILIKKKIKFIFKLYFQLQHQSLV